MNLNKLWNPKFLWQNIKKSKMTIALFFMIVPVFTSLIIIASGNETMTFETLASMNILGMYVIPFIFSICMFGYVFKKNSVDFMNSMPISRKCVFITNTIGGMILILLLQVVTFLLTLLISSLTDSAVFISMVWDILLFQTISYIFVFTAANLAMTVSGTLVTQIAVTMLIIFVVPFTTLYVNVMTSNVMGNAYTLMNDGVEVMQLNKVGNYTAPFLIANDGMYQYNVISLWKMIALSIIYFAIGLILFERRKMEVAGESFENKYAHFLAKGLTLIPFVAVLKAVATYEEMTLVMIILAIIVVYYLVFDLITSKKIKFWENLIALIVSVVIIYGGYSIAIGVNKHIHKTVELNTIKMVNVNINDRFYTQVTEKNAVQSTIIALAKAEGNYYYNDYRYRVRVELIKNNGAKFVEYCYINEKMLSEIFDANYQNISLSKNAIISNENIQLTKEENDTIIQLINESLKELSLKDLLEEKDDIDYLNVYLNEYQNHELIETYYPATLHKDIQKIMMTAYNRKAISSLKSGLHNIYYTIDSFTRFDEETRQKVWFVTDYGDEKMFTDFILANAENHPEDITKCIKIGTYKFSFYTDNIDDFLKMIDQFCQEKQEEFEEYQNGFNDDYYEPKAIYEEDLSASGEKNSEENLPVAILDDTL